jgi:MoaA/NifB/PqqE/SkfB family radical SAM enzyme
MYPAGGGTGTEATPRASTACAAPFVAMEFDQFGDVQACCANALYPLGNVRDLTVAQIWRGERADALRDALRRHDFSLGCTVCRHRLRYGYGELPRDYYDNFPMSSVDPEWPFSLQFSLHNTCNLACAMCGADRSSTIRSRRAELAPLPHAYPDRFFDEIVPFLHHAGAVDFSGGEPFLVAEHFRIWDVLAEMAERPLCSLTTNGTVWNDRVEQVLERVPSHISVSIDGVTAPTFESIRVGARFDEVMINLDRFADYTARHDTQLTITWSLVRQNWFELGRMLTNAEERGIPVKVQTVIEPDFGVQRLPTPELEEVVAALEVEGERIRPALSINGDMWDRELRRLRDELRHRADDRPVPRYMEPPTPDGASGVEEVVVRHLDGARRSGLGARFAAAARTRRATTELATWLGREDVGRVDLDRSGRVRRADLADVLPKGVRPLGSLAGRSLADLLDELAGSMESSMWIADEEAEGDEVRHTLWFGRAMRDKVGLVVRTIAVAAPDGIRLLVAADDRLLERTDPGVPVSMSATRRRRPVAS